MSKCDKTSMKTQKDKNQHIQVFVRVRPQSQHEKQKNLFNVVECPSSKEITVRDKVLSSNVKTFTFDRVFDMSSKQVDVYRHVVSPLIDEVLAGYNCTVFAYGQTGTGKTYTMEGERSFDPSISWENDPLSGIIPRTLSHLFDELRKQDLEFTVRVSFLELYNEELIDLLAPSTGGTKLRIFEDVAKKGSVIIQGLEEITVHDKNDVYEILTRGSERRQTAATMMNAHSSRSHTVFSITVHIKENLMGGDELLKTGKLNLVDLAGSENIGRSGAVEKRAREAGNINQSLLTLGRVITSLVERAPHVPYRESKLTRLLQDSLGGKTKTCFIATISSVAINLEETLSTLDYAHRAKDITNRPEINQKLSKKELLKEYTEEIERLRRDLVATREKNGVYVDPGEFERMMGKLHLLEHENAEKFAHIKALREEMEKKEALCEELHMQVSKKNVELNHKTEMLKETEGRLKHTHSKLVSTEQDRHIKEQLVNYHVTKEIQLSEQAHSLVKVADQSTADVSLLHDKLARKRSVEEGNKNRGEQFSNRFSRNVEQMDASLEKLLSEHTVFCGNLRSALGELQDQKTSELTIMSEHLTKEVQLFDELLHIMEQKSAEAMRNAQHQIQVLIENARTAGASVEDFRTSFTELILPPLQGVSEHLQKAKMDLQELSNQVNDKIRESEYTLELYSLETTDAINGIEESMAHYILQRKQESERLATLRRNMLEDSEAEHREMQAQMRAMMEIMHRMEALGESRQQRTNLSDAELGQGLNHCDTLTEAIAGEMKKATGSLKKKLTKYTTSGKQTSEEIQKILREFVEKRTVAINHKEHLREEAVASCWSALNSHEEQWRQYYQSTEEQVRDHSEMLKRYLQSEHEQTQTLSTKVRETAEIQESQLESQRRSFRSFMQQRQDDLEEECSIIRERGKMLSDEMRKREVELNHFFSMEHINDQPTGETPPRREYIYPRRLISSSPREIVIKRFQTQMDSVKVLQAVLENVEAVKKEKMNDNLSSSTMSLPDSVFEESSELSAEHQGLSKASSETNVPLVIDDGNFEDEHENKENKKVLLKAKSKSHLKQPRRIVSHGPLTQKNDD